MRWPNRLGCAAAGLAALLVGFTWPVWRHDLALARFHAAVRDLPLPADSSIAASEEAFGLLWCCSNHCDAEVKLALTGAADGQAVAAALSASPTVPGPFSDAVYWQLYAIAGDQVEEVDSQGRPSAPESDRERDEIVAFAASAPGSPHLVLVARDQTFEASHLWDPRCH